LAQLTVDIPLSRQQLFMTVDIPLSGQQLFIEAEDIFHIWENSIP